MHCEHGVHLEAAPSLTGLGGHACRRRPPSRPACQGVRPPRRGRRRAPHRGGGGLVGVRAASVRARLWLPWIYFCCALPARYSRPCGAGGGAAPAGARFQPPSLPPIGRGMGWGFGAVGGLRRPAPACACRCFPTTFGRPFYLAALSTSTSAPGRWRGEEGRADGGLGPGGRAGGRRERKLTMEGKPLGRRSGVGARCPPRAPRARRGGRGGIRADGQTAESNQSRAEPRVRGFVFECVSVCDWRACVCDSLHSAEP